MKVDARPEVNSRIATFASCGFANFSSSESQFGVQIGALSPNRGHDLRPRAPFDSPARWPFHDGEIAASSLMALYDQSRRRRRHPLAWSDCQRSPLCSVRAGAISPAPRLLADRSLCRPGGSCRTCPRPRHRHAGNLCRGPGPSHYDAWRWPAASTSTNGQRLGSRLLCGPHARASWAYRR